MDESLQEIKNQIQKLKKERNAVILAHYYVPGEVQDIADFVGDSYYLSKIAASAKEDKDLHHIIEEKVNTPSQPAGHLQTKDFYHQQFHQVIEPLHLQQLSV